MNKKDLELIINDYLNHYEDTQSIIDIENPQDPFKNSIIENIALVYLNIQSNNINTEEGIDEDLFQTIESMLLERKEVIKPSYNILDLQNLNQKINRLKSVKQPEQRSPEWYIYRKNRLTASDLGTAINRNPYGNRKKLIAKKCGYEEKFIVGQAITHGIKFEPVATSFYEKINNVHVFEYGCIPHPKIDYFGASPDGICDIDSQNKQYIGRMLEIKCPKSRPITGFVPEYYELQIQGQLEVCDLEFCDYLECSFKEFNTIEEFLDNDKKDIKFKGIIVEKYNTTLEKSEYIYYYIEDINKEDIHAWIEKNINEILDTDGYVYIKTTYWQLTHYNIVLVKRDKNRFDNELLPLITKFWEEVLHYRKIGYQDLVKKNDTKINYKAKPELTFLEDSD